MGGQQGASRGLTDRCGATTLGCPHLVTTVPCRRRVGWGPAALSCYTAQVGRGLRHGCLGRTPVWHGPGSGRRCCRAACRRGCRRGAAGAGSGPAAPPGAPAAAASAAGPRSTRPARRWPAGWRGHRRRSPPRSAAIAGCAQRPAGASRQLLAFNTHQTVWVRHQRRPGPDGKAGGAQCNRRNARGPHREPQGAGRHARCGGGVRPAWQRPLALGSTLPTWLGLDLCPPLMRRVGGKQLMLCSCPSPHPHNRGGCPRRPRSHLLSPLPHQLGMTQTAAAENKLQVAIDELCDNGMVNTHPSDGCGGQLVGAGFPAFPHANPPSSVLWSRL